MISTITEMMLALGGRIELAILSKATIILLLGLFIARLAGRVRASVRHLLLASTLLTALALPIIAVIAPEVTIEIPGASESITAPRTAVPVTAPVSVAAGVAERQAAEISSHSFSLPSWPTIAWAVWMIGAALLLLSLAVDLWRLNHLRRHGLPWLEMRGYAQSLAFECGIYKSIDVLVHEEISAPLTCGIWSPAILLPADARAWSEGDLRRALIHELEHVQRGDWGIQLAARVTCALYWFHPLVWMAWRRLCLEAERACDDAVLVSAERADYAEQLMSLAQRLSATRARATLSMANRSDLSTRISTILDGSQQRGRAGLLAAASAISIASLIVLGVAPVRAVAKATTPAAVSISEPLTPPAAAQNRRESGALDEALYKAAERGNLADIEKLLSAGANVNCALDGDGSPLIGAARRGRLDAVRLLLDRGADVNLAVSGDGNPLIMAAREGHKEIVALLLDRGASINQVVPEDENALIQASAEGKLEVVELLVARGADVNARAWAEGALERPNGEWRTPLSMARKGRHEAIIKVLMAAGAKE
jgi:beta-lactamase regulating signal transducer with metallopeptidase domain